MQFVHVYFIVIYYVARVSERAIVSVAGLTQYRLACCNISF